MKTSMSIRRMMLAATFSVLIAVGVGATIPVVLADCGGPQGSGGCKEAQQPVEPGFWERLIAVFELFGI